AEATLRHVTTISSCPNSSSQSSSPCGSSSQDRADVALEVLALRQQLAVLKRKRPRPPLNALDRLFWTTLSRCWPRWMDVLEIVKSKTVVGWQRAGFRGIGVGNLGPVAAGRRSPRKFEP